MILVMYSMVVSNGGGPVAVLSGNVKMAPCPAQVFVPAGCWLCPPQTSYHRHAIVSGASESLQMGAAI